MSADVVDFNRRRLEESRAAAPQWTFADRVRKIRRLQGITQNEFAARVDVPPGTIRAWEADQVEPARGTRMIFSVKCQVAFGIPAWWTMGYEGPWDPTTETDPQIRATAMVILEEEMRARNAVTREYSNYGGKVVALRKDLCLTASSLEDPPSWRQVA